MWFVLLRAQLPPQAREKMKVHLCIRSYRTRLIDFGNLVGGAKIIPDCLQKLGYIFDDSPIGSIAIINSFKSQRLMSELR